MYVQRLDDFRYIETEDGSLSCVDPDSAELYHNRAGAYLEALKNYAEPASLLLGQRLNSTVPRNSVPKSIKVLDVCFGLGYNTLALIQLLSRDVAPTMNGNLQPLGISVLAIDVDARVCSAVKTILNQTCFSELRERFPHVSYGRNQIEFANRQTQISLQIEIADFRAVMTELAYRKEDFDVIFHDPFSPAKVPELWTLEIFERYHCLLERRQGHVLTYSSAGCVRGALQRSGFQVYRTEAVGGKSGGTCAAVPISTALTIGSAINNYVLIPLSDDEESRLRGISGIPYRDPSANATRQSIRDARKLAQSNFTIDR